MHMLLHGSRWGRAGATLAEYVLILGLIFVVILIVFRMLGI